MIIILDIIIKYSLQKGILSDVFTKKLPLAIKLSVSRPIGEQFFFVHVNHFAKNESKNPVLLKHTQTQTKKHRHKLIKKE